jgi:lipopolysaccharide transport system ATP-binding protein
MSSDIAIKVENLSKCYQIYDHPQDRLKQILMRGRKQYYREFWALKDLSFEIKKGETVGIIGRNGSGKSTLLQMICGTLNPSSGSIQTNGRIAALLELGSGFNPEFTGFENIYLNAKVLGLTEKETDSKLNSIIEFADIGDFINQPVKTYSSGMMVRLAFSVAIHVEPDILVVDEALSVGDAYFQAKCANKIKSIISDGATVLFVSHDTSSVKSLCNKALLLNSGRHQYYGDVNTAVEKYYSALVADQRPKGEATSLKHRPFDVLDPSASNNSTFLSIANFQRIQNGAAEFINVMMLDDQGSPTEAVTFGQKVTLRQIIQINSSISKLGFAYHIRDKNGQDIIYSDSGIESGGQISPISMGGVYVADWTFTVHLREGYYVVSSMASEPIDLELGNVNVIDFIPISLKFTVSRGQNPPIYAAVYWENEYSLRHINNA